MANPPLTKTRRSTLYRLLGIEPNIDALFNAFEPQLEKIEADGGAWEPTVIAGCPALVLSGGRPKPPGWLAEAQTTTGMFFGFKDCQSFVLIAMVVDEHVYALGFGHGHRFIPAHCKDSRFGLSIASRVADTERVKDLVRRRAGQGGRVDATLSAGGMPFWMIPLDQHNEIVSRLGAQVGGLELTATQNGQRPTLIDGGVGLQARYGVQPEDLVEDIRTIADTLERKEPVPELAFIEHLSLVQEPERREWLDARLDEILASVETSQTELALAIPDECLEDYREARGAKIRIGSKAVQVEEVTVEAIANRTAVQPPGTRMEALRGGKIQLFGDQACGDRLSHAQAVKWIETTVSQGSRRFHLLDGEWLEIDGLYADAQDEFIEDLLTRPGGMELPAWLHGEDEGAYLKLVAASRNMPLMDQQWIYPGGGRRFEACDLLGPDDELVHVKQAGSSKPLSHLFNQGLVSAFELHTSRKVRDQFARVVERQGKGRTIDYGFVPKKVVFAFRRASGKPLTVQSLFPFSKIALAHTANRLQDMGIEVQVIIIDTVHG